MSFEIKKGVLKHIAPEPGELDIIIPGEVKVIGAKALEDGSNLHSIVIPDGVEEIKQYAFYLIDNHAEEIFLPNSLKVLAKNALPAETERLTFATGVLNCLLSHDSYEISEIVAYILEIGDKEFSDLRAGSRLEIAASILSAPHLCPKKDVPNVEKYLKSQKKKLLHLIWDKKSVELLKGMTDKSLLSEKEIDELLDSKTDSAEIKAFLLEQKKDKPALQNDKDPFKPLTVTEAKKTWTFTKAETGNGYKIKSYKGRECEVSVPAIIGKLPVKEVEGFCNCGYNSNFTIERVNWMKESITQIIFPEGLIKIGGCSCTGLESLKSLVIAPGVISIENSAFKDCIALTEIRLPEGVVSLESIAFSGCTALRHAYLPASLTEIQSTSFHKCRNLTIHALEGSYAEHFAKENGIRFEKI